MAEYIERDVLLKAVEKMDRLDKETKTKYEYNKEGYILLLKNAPTVEAKPVVHAHWEFCGVSFGKKIYKCSNCKTFIEGTGTFCKACGAQMDDHIADVRKKEE